MKGRLQLPEAVARLFRYSCRAGGGCARRRSSRLWEFTPGCRCDVLHGTCHFVFRCHVVDLRIHRIFAFGGRQHQSVKAGSNARRPRSSIAKFRRARHPRGVTRRALRFIDFFTGARRCRCCWPRLQADKTHFLNLLIYAFLHSRLPGTSNRTLSQRKIQNCGKKHYAQTDNESPNECPRRL